MLRFYRRVQPFLKKKTTRMDGVPDWSKGRSVVSDRSSRFRERLDKLSQRFQYIYGEIVASLWGTDLGPLDELAGCDQHLARNGYALGPCRFRSLCTDHALENFIGHRNPQLILHKFRVTRAD